MKYPLLLSGLLLVIAAGLNDCRKAYLPPAIRASNHFVAIDGVINTGPNIVTTIHLGRSANLSDSVTNLPETGAQVSIVGSGGDSYQLSDTASNGNYSSQALNLSAESQYRVEVTTADGNVYQTDLLTPQPAAALDSVTWELTNDPVLGVQAVRIYVNGHDDANATHFYRWDYLETWEHVSALESPYVEANGRISSLPPGVSTHVCYSTAAADHIIIASSVALKEDRITHQQVALFVQNDPKLDIGYSILVRQYPLSLEAFNYWSGVEKNSQSLGGLFDLQPSQVNGNFHGITHPEIPALGYVSASEVSEERIFISNKSLPGWKSNPLLSCKEITLPPGDQLDLLAYSYPDTAYSIYHYIGDFIISQVLAPKACLYCTYQGGVTEKPTFWP